MDRVVPLPVSLPLRSELVRTIPSAFLVWLHASSRTFGPPSCGIKRCFGRWEKCLVCILLKIPPVLGWLFIFITTYDNHGNGMFGVHFWGQRIGIMGGSFDLSLLYFCKTCIRHSIYYYDLGGLFLTCFPQIILVCPCCEASFVSCILHPYFSLTSLACSCCTPLVITCVLRPFSSSPCLCLLSSPSSRQPCQPSFLPPSDFR